MRSPGMWLRDYAGQIRVYVHTVTGSKGARVVAAADVAPVFSRQT